MTHTSASDTIARALGIGAIIVLMGAGLRLVSRVLVARDKPPAHPPATRMDPSSRSIAAEAEVFETRSSDLSVALAAEPRRDARHRTLAIYRSLRAYPGAPPRIPHGLTDEEFRRGLCNSCHLRGGYVARFGAYAPVTPHPQYADCAQCHAPDGANVGIGFPGAVDPVVCGQCHPAPGARTVDFAPLDWRPMAWPEPGPPALDGAPPLIPHDLQLRGNCLACHAGPGAVTEIRTTHPDRGNCRQCHVSAPTEHGEFARQPAGAGGPRGDGR